MEPDARESPDPAKERERVFGQFSCAGTRVADLETPKKSAAQIAAATRFRSTGTQLTTRELANASGDTPEEKEQMFKLMGTVLTAYETEARKIGRQNDFALALAVALAVNSSVYNGKPEPNEARLLEIGDAIGELMAEDNVFGGITDKQKQEMYESMVIFTMLVQAGANEAKTKRRRGKCRNISPAGRKSFDIHKRNAARKNPARHRGCRNGRRQPAPAA
ncbi:MAG: hypothetical protein H0V18_07685 [Pyrinomonadaceae bacterium]|nr:hypothetical protein [Pyrinomonadaceae bacterium]